MTQAPLPTDPDLELARQYGDLRGTLDGQRAALDRIEAQAYLAAYHAELQAAGLCRCDEIAAAQSAQAVAVTAPAARVVVDHKTVSDALTGFVGELSRIASGLLQPKRHHCSICGQPGPTQHEGNTYVCAPCNAIAGTAKEEQLAAAARDGAGEPVAVDEPEPTTAGPRPQAHHRRPTTAGPLPHCGHGCDNEAQDPACPRHGASTTQAATR